ncbi:hypothetical protein D3C78_1754790 [compost metagenome]
MVGRVESSSWLSAFCWEMVWGRITSRLPGLARCTPLITAALVPPAPEVITWLPVRAMA